jgi:hypothetical protein
MVFAMVLNTLNPVSSTSLYQWASFVYASSFDLALSNIFLSLFVSIKAILNPDIARIVFYYAVIGPLANLKVLYRAGAGCRLLMVF